MLVLRWVHYLVVVVQVQAGALYELGQPVLYACSQMLLEIAYHREDVLLHQEVSQVQVFSQYRYQIRLHDYRLSPLVQGLYDLCDEIHRSDVEVRLFVDILKIVTLDGFQHVGEDLDAAIKDVLGVWLDRLLDGRYDRLEALEESQQTPVAVIELFPFLAQQWQ